MAFKLVAETEATVFELAVVAAVFALLENKLAQEGVEGAAGVVLETGGAKFMAGVMGVSTAVALLVAAGTGVGVALEPLCP